MAGTYLIDAKKYAIFVSILSGQGDGPLITIDANGKVHIDHEDPGLLRYRVSAAVRQIEAGVDVLHALTDKVVAHV